MSEKRKIRVLCVEDEKDIRENIADILKDEGFEVFEAANGKLGFESFIENKPDIIISDIMMPEMDGYELLKTVRNNKNTRNNNIPFIFLTALGQKDNVIKGVNLSANDYLVKPIDFDMMIAKVKEKTNNLLKVQESHTQNIKNIKSQVSIVLPAEITSYLDIITQISSILKEEPYGPLPHRRYIEDINKIYINATKIRSTINNSLDESVLDQKLNSNEEIINVINVINKFVSNLSEKFRKNIEVEEPFEAESMPRIKIDRLVLLDAFRKIFAGLFKTDIAAKVNVSIMVDHLNQLVIIFYLQTNQEQIDMNRFLNKEKIAAILENQNCSFEFAEGKENTVVLVIPSHRLV